MPAYLCLAYALLVLWLVAQLCRWCDAWHLLLVAAAGCVFVVLLQARREG